MQIAYVAIKLKKLLISFNAPIKLCKFYYKLHEKKKKSEVRDAALPSLLQKFFCVIFVNFMSKTEMTQN